MRTIDLRLGNNKDVLPTMAENSVDSIIVDTPYELGFMGKAWDKSGIAFDVEMWKMGYRVLKPGGYLLAFGGSRTYHRIACAIEDAGFEIRDQIMWIYASGFPKSMNVSKQFDKAAGVKRKVIGRYQPPNGKEWNLKNDNIPPGYNDGLKKRSDSLNVTAPVTDLAKQWDGWGTALKPAHEPIVVARKPFVGTVINNIVQYGTGAINIDACRIEFAGEADLKAATFGTGNDIKGGNFNSGTKPTGETNIEANPKGRWPSNLIHDGSEDVMNAFAQFGEKQSGKPSGIRSGVQRYAFSEYAGGIPVTGYGDSGSISRFFYCAKADASDRHEGILKKPRPQFKHGNTMQKVEQTKTVGNDHETVKPVALMRYLCKLVTPPVVLYAISLWVLAPLVKRP